jgi:hypothetical protein
LSQESVAISFLADSVCLNFFGLFGECVCIHCFDCWLLFGLSIKKWNPNFFNCYAYYVTENFIAIFVESLWKVKADDFLCVLCAAVSIFGTQLPQNYDSLACSKCDSFVENSVLNLWKFEQEFWNCQAPSFTIFFHDFEQDHQ